MQGGMMANKKGGLLDCVVAVLGLADDFDVGFGFQERCQTHVHHCVVVGYEDSYFLFHEVFAEGAMTSCVPRARGAGAAIPRLASSGGRLQSRRTA